MKEIFIVLTHTGTILSSIVRFYTKDKYTHVSVGLDSKLEQLYSFGRLNPYNPYKGGFVHEKIDKGTFKRFKNTKTAVYKLKITDKQYEKMKSKIEEIEKKKDKYKFNVMGLFLVSINKRLKRKNKFYCAEFVKYVLEYALNEKLLPEIIKPMDFLILEDRELVYEGLLKKYEYNKDIYENKNEVLEYGIG